MIVFFSLGNNSFFSLGNDSFFSPGNGSFFIHLAMTVCDIILKFNLFYHLHNKVTSGEGRILAAGEIKCLEEAINRCNFIVEVIEKVEF